MQFHLSKQSMPTLILELNRLLEKNQLLLITIKSNDVRSKDQNKRLWGYLYKSVGDFLGYSSMEIHYLCGAMFLTSDITIHGKTIQHTKSTTDLTVSEMANYMTQIEAYFAQFGWSGE